MFNKKEKKGDFIIVRTCVGCVLPSNAKLLSYGSYILRKNGKNIDERYYDYIIDNNQFNNFIEENYNQLVEYKLIDDFKKEKEKGDGHIDPIQVDALKGYSPEYKKKEY